MVVCPLAFLKQPPSPKSTNAAHLKADGPTNYKRGKTALQFTYWLLFETVQQGVRHLGMGQEFSVVPFTGVPFRVSIFDPQPGHGPKPKSYPQ